MPRRGWTAKPCEGCDGDRQLASGRMIGKLCRQCDELIELALLYQERQSAQLDREHEVFRTQQRRYYRATISRGHYDLGGAVDALIAHYGSQLQGSADTVDETPPLFLRGKARADDTQHSHLVVMLRFERDLWDTLDRAIAEQLESAYLTGRGDGSSSLARLAAGDLSVLDFEQETEGGRRPLELLDDVDHFDMATRCCERRRDEHADFASEYQSRSRSTIPNAGVVGGHDFYPGDSIATTEPPPRVVKIVEGT